MAVLVLLLLCVLPRAAVAYQPPTSAAQEGFVPVQDLAQQEQLPATPLVTAAYSFAWVAVFGYLWSIWRRLARVEREIAEVTRRLESGARR